MQIRIRGKIFSLIANFPRIRYPAPETVCRLVFRRSEDELVLNP